MFWAVPSICPSSASLAGVKYDVPIAGSEYRKLVRYLAESSSCETGRFDYPSPSRRRFCAVKPKIFPAL